MITSPMPNLKIISTFLQTLTHKWPELNEPSLLEIRALKDGNAGNATHFKADEIASASHHASELNADGWNIYACVNPLIASTVGAATDEDILAAFYVFADADDENGAASIASSPLPASMLVTTGTVPWIRMHGYWELDEAYRDMTAWRKIQQNIAAKLGTDKSIVNPSRIMRLAGTVAYPSASKERRGYVPECTYLELGGSE